MVTRIVGMSLLSTLLLTGCAADLYLGAASPPPPPARVEVIPVPPPRRVEVIPVAPSRDHVWVGGRWNWNPERHAHVWVPGYWNRRG